MVAAESTRKRARSRTPARVTPRRPAARRVAKPDPLHDELSQHIRELKLATAVVFTVAKALERQAAEQDEDLAHVLKRHVGDVLALEIEKVLRLAQEREVTIQTLMN